MFKVSPNIVNDFIEVKLRVLHKGCGYYLPKCLHAVWHTDIQIYVFPLSQLRIFLSSLTITVIFWYTIARNMREKHVRKL